MPFGEHLSVQKVHIHSYFISYVYYIRSSSGLTNADIHERNEMRNKCDLYREKVNPKKATELVVFSSSSGNGYRRMIYFVF